MYVGMVRGCVCTWCGVCVHASHASLASASAGQDDAGVYQCAVNQVQIFRTEHEVDQIASMPTQRCMCCVYVAGARFAVLADV